MRHVRYVMAILVWEIGIIAELAGRAVVLYFVWPVMTAKFNLPNLTLIEAGVVILLLSLLVAIARAPFAGPWTAPPRRNPFVP